MKTIMLMISCPHLEYGRVLNEMRMFREAGFDVSVYGWDRLQEYPKEESRFGCTIRRCHVPGAFSSMSLLFSMPVWWAAELFHLIRHRPDYVYAIGFDTVMPALVFRWLRGTPVILSILDFWAVKTSTIPSWLRRIVAKAERVCAHAADGVVSVDESRTCLFGKTPPKRLVIAPNCAYDAVWPDCEKLRPKELTIFYPGTVSSKRGQ